MTKLTELAEIDTLDDGDVFYVYDVSQPGSPDKKISGSKLRPGGARVTNYQRFGGNVTLPNITAGTEMNMAISVPGALVGDHVLFNPDDALPSGLGIMYARVSSSNTVTVRIRNFGATDFASAAMAALVLVTRSVA